MKIIVSIILLLFFSCSSNKRTIHYSLKDQPECAQIFASGSPVLVYKTKANYNDLVPVILSDNKSEILTYPHPSDLVVKNSYQTPTILHNGYLLDNRGISKNVAFINMTYNHYALLKESPSIIELDKLIIDKDPLIELYNCGIKTSFTNLEDQLNSLIDSDKLRTNCKIIK